MGAISYIGHVIRPYAILNTVPSNNLGNVYANSISFIMESCKLKHGMSACRFLLTWKPYVSFNLDSSVNVLRTTKSIMVPSKGNPTHCLIIRYLYLYYIIRPMFLFRPYMVGTSSV